MRPIDATANTSSIHSLTAPFHTLSSITAAVAHIQIYNSIMHTHGKIATL